MTSATGVGVVLVLCAAPGASGGRTTEGAVPPVAVVAEPALDCPRARAIERALAELRGGDSSPSGDGAAAASLTLEVARAPHGVRINLRDASGAGLLSRDLAVTPSHCDSAAAAIAIIVERYFRDVAWNAAAPTPAPAPGTPAKSAPPAAAPPPAAGPPPPIGSASAAPPTSTTPPPGSPAAAPASAPSPAAPATAPSLAVPAPTPVAPAPPPTPVPTRSATPARATPVAPAASATASAPPATDAAVVPSRAIFSPAPRLVFGAGPALATRPGLGVSLAVDARFRLAGLLGAGVAVWLPLMRTDETLGAAPTQGRAHLAGVPVSARIAVAGQRGRLAWTAGAETLVTFEEGQTQNIAVPATARRTVLAAGLVVGASYVLGARFRIATDVGGYRTLLGSSFVVGGIGGAVLEPPVWQGLFSVRLEWIAVY